jgi:hypothetical protein
MKENKLQQGVYIYRLVNENTLIKLSGKLIIE